VEERSDQRWRLLKRENDQANYEKAPADYLVQDCQIYEDLFLKCDPWKTIERSCSHRSRRGCAGVRERDKNDATETNSVMSRNS
jgi:hypothetical protein